MPDRPANSGRHRKRDREPAALALAGGATIKDAAAKCGASERSLRYWLRDEAFKALIQSLRSEMFGRAVGRLADMGGVAAQALTMLLGARSEAVKLGAARSILELGPRLREHTDLAAEVKELREIVEGMSREHPR